MKTKYKLKPWTLVASDVDVVRPDDAKELKEMVEKNEDNIWAYKQILKKLGYRVKLRTHYVDAGPQIGPTEGYLYIKGRPKKKDKKIINKFTNEIDEDEYEEEY